jgi:hypothetical protein
MQRNVFVGSKFWISGILLLLLIEIWDVTIDITEYHVLIIPADEHNYTFTMYLNNRTISKPNVTSNGFVNFGVHVAATGHIVVGA